MTRTRRPRTCDDAGSFATLVASAACPCRCVSVVGAMLLRVLTTSDLLAAYTADCPADPLAATGFAELDALTGGMAPGRVWILVSTPGQGRSTLVTQWAAAIAEGSDRAVQLVTPRDSPSVVAARLLSRVGRVPLSHLTNHQLNVNDDQRLRLVGDRLASLNLHVFPKGDAVFVPEVEAVQLQKTAAVFLDDADRISGLTQRWVAARAATGMFILVSMPRHHVLPAPDHEADLDPTWAGVADVVLEIRHRGLPNGAYRPGEAEMHLHYNRFGYTRTISAAHQAHFSRFVESASVDPTL